MEGHVTSGSTNENLVFGLCAVRMERYFVLKLERFVPTFKKLKV